MNTLCPISGPHSTATLDRAVGDKGMDLKINKWNWVHWLGEHTGTRLLAGSTEWSLWMRHFPIEVIKMIEDSGKLVHLAARWRGTCPTRHHPWGKTPQPPFLSLLLSLFSLRSDRMHGTRWRVSVSDAAERRAKWDWHGGKQTLTGEARLFDCVSSQQYLPSHSEQPTF